jgi:hypothetical protein
MNFTTTGSNKGPIRIYYREYTKQSLIEIAKSDDSNIDDFLIFDIASILEDSNIMFNNLIYITDIEVENNPYITGDAIYPFIKSFCLYNDNFSIIVFRKAIPNDIGNEKTLRRFASDITAIHMSNFVDINSFCQLEYSLPFLFIDNIPSRLLYEEITTMVFKPVEPAAENND